MELVLEMSLDGLFNPSHVEVLVSQLVVVEHKTHDPLGRVATDHLIHLRHVLIQAQQLFIILHNGPGRVRVVVDRRAFENVAERRVLDLGAELVGDRLVALVGVLQVDLHAGSLDVLGYVDDLLQARHTKRHVLGRHTGLMEGVQGHLGGWLSQRLRRDRTNHLAWVHDSLVEARLDLTYDPVEGLRTESLVDDHVLSAQKRPQVNLEEPGGVLLGLQDEGIGSHIYSWNRGEFIRELLELLHDVSRLKVSLRVRLNLELLFRVDNDPRHVNTEMD